GASLIASLCLWQRDREARTRHAAIGVHPVACTDRAAMRFNDLPGDCQTKARMFTETVRPVGVEPVKDALEILRLEARPFIFHANDDAARLTGCDDMNRAARRGEGKRIVDQVTDDLTKPRIKALYRHLVPARRTPIDLERDTGVARRTCLIEEIANGFKQGR